jgi:hypothetical protein
MEKTATAIKTLNHWNGLATVYKVEPAIKSYENNSYDYVVVSQVNALYSGPETYMFGSNEDGEVTDWCELPGSRRGSYTHEEVLNDEGYTVIPLTTDAKRV